MANRPLIGITPGYSAGNDRLYIPNGYMEGICRAGGLAVLLPLTTDEDLLSDAVGRCDGLLLAGGPDIDARYFGESNLRFTGVISPLRDSMEISAANLAFGQKKPILGICRGIQVLNVALGGTIFQDIYSQIKGAELLKHSQEAPGWHPVHDIRLKKDSRLCKCIGSETAGVNSFHHQAVKDPGRGLKVVAEAGDGVIEAVEHESSVFTVGVQWHPELMRQSDTVSARLFGTFVRAAGGEAVWADE